MSKIDSNPDFIVVSGDFAGHNLKDLPTTLTAGIVSVTKQLSFISGSAY